MVDCTALIYMEKTPVPRDEPLIMLGIMMEVLTPDQKGFQNHMARMRPAIGPNVTATNR